MHLGFSSVVLFGLVYVVPNILGCSVLTPGARAVETGDKFEVDERKIYYTDNIVYGEIVGKVEGDYPFKGISGVHTVKFKVVCTYKGNIKSDFIYIAGMGNENGQLRGCPAAPVRMENMVMFLKSTGIRDVFEIEFTPNYFFGDNPYNMEIILDDLAVSCGLTLTHDRDAICMNFLPLTEEDGCVTWTPIVIDPEVTTKLTSKRKPKPEVTQKPERDNNKSGPTTGNENEEIPKCPAAPLKKEKRTIMFLKATNEKDVFEVEFEPTTADTGFEQMMDDFTILCNISLTHDPEKICDPYEPLSVDDGCVFWTPIPPLPTTTTKVVTTPEAQPEPEEEPEPTEGSNKPKQEVEIDGKDSDDEHKQSDDPGYNTGNGEDTSAVKGSDDENGSTVISASIIATVVSIILALVV